MRLLIAVTIGLILCGAAAPVDAQRLTSSLYVGAGNGTNLGGDLGIGSELRIGEYLSLNAALGYLRADASIPTEDRRNDFDVGMKIYPFREWVYLGLNFGLVEYWVDNRLEPASIERTRAFSFTFGARTPAWRRLYASAFLGTTSDGSSNEFFDSFMPRLGLMIGYEFSR